MRKTKKLLFVFGTRPEAIKLAPVILRARATGKDFSTFVCSTGQHREMIEQVLPVFGIQPSVNLNVMRRGQDLFDLTSRLITALKPVVQSTRPDWIVVQGDTTTVWTAALCGFYEGIRVAHIEAGLRTFDKRQPFPEEINRRLCTHVADLHFAPTERSRLNLLAEGVRDEHIVVCGNTVIDSLLWIMRKNRATPGGDVQALQQWHAKHVGARPMVLVTGHRRESFGTGFENICGAIRDLARRYLDVQWVYPVHLNPHVQEPVNRIISKQRNVHLLAPQPYAAFVWLLSKACLVLTDSGGIQEEAPSLGKFVMVMRNTTERPEGVEAGCVQVVGNDQASIVEHVSQFVASGQWRARLPKRSPYGDGRSANRIIDVLRSFKE